MANDTKTPTQLDIEMNNIDRAIRAVRDYQKGAATTTFVKASLKAVKPGDLEAVSLATRVPMARLEGLRTES